MKKQLQSLTLILAGLAMLGPFCIDTYLPSFASIARDFGVTPILVQQTLSVYLLCFAGMMLFHGTLSDSFGRRPVILASLGIFTAASVGAALAPQLEWLILFRALQGLSAGAGTVVGRAMVRDCWDGPQAQKVLSDITLVFALAPAIAPILGGWLQVWFGWRAVFVFLAAVGLALGTICWRALPESLAPADRHRFHYRPILRNYFTVIRNPRFVLLALAMGLASIGFFVYIAAAPQFVMQVLRRPETAFGWLFLPLVGGMALGASAAGRLAHHWPTTRLIKTGYLLMALAALANVIYNLLLPAQLPWAVLPLFLYTVGIALASPSTMVLALNVFPAMRGMAASLQAFIQTLLFALVAAAVAPVIGASALGLALFLMTSTAGSLGCLLLLARMRRRMAAPYSGQHPG